MYPFKEKKEQSLKQISAQYAYESLMEGMTIRCEDKNGVSVYITQASAENMNRLHPLYARHFNFYEVYPT